MMLVLRIALGLVLGLFFYGGLQLTVRRLALTRHPAALTLGSLLLRMGVAVTVLFFLTAGHWQNALAALAGFTAARFLLPFRPPFGLPFGSKHASHSR